MRIFLCLVEGIRRLVGRMFSRVSCWPSHLDCFNLGLELGLAVLSPWNHWVIHLVDWHLFSTLLCRRRASGTAFVPRRDGEEAEDGFLGGSDLDELILTLRFVFFTGYLPFYPARCVSLHWFPFCASYVISSSAINDRAIEDWIRTTVMSTGLSHQQADTAMWLLLQILPIQFTILDSRRRLIFLSKETKI